MECIDLPAVYGDRYRITLDEAAGPRPSDPWHAQIPCRHGIIYPHGGDLLALEIDGRPKIAAMIARIPGVRVHQDGDDEKTLLFPSRLFEAVAAIVHPHKTSRRELTPEETRKFVQAGAKYRFSTGTLQGFTGERRHIGEGVGVLPLPERDSPSKHAFLDGEGRP